MDDFRVDHETFRTFEYHVVQDPDEDRTILTIKLYKDDDLTIRLDPSEVEFNGDFAMLAERRVRYLYSHGRI